MLTHPAKLRLINTGFWASNGHGTKMSPRNRNVTFTQSQQHIINPANLCRTLDDCVKNRLHVGGRAADDAEHLGSCRLMLQRLAQFRSALLKFFEQADVLDGDYGLVGKGLEQADLCICKRSDLDSAQ